MISSFKLAVIHVNSFYHTRNEALYLFERGPVDHVLLPRHDEMQIVDNGATVGHCSVFMGCTVTGVVACTDMTGFPLSSAAVWILHYSLVRLSSMACQWIRATLFVTCSDIVVNKLSPLLINLHSQFCLQASPLLQLTRVTISPGIP